MEQTLSVFSSSYLAFLEATQPSLPFLLGSHHFLVSPQVARYLSPDANSIPDGSPLPPPFGVFNPLYMFPLTRFALLCLRTRFPSANTTISTLPQTPP